MTAAELLGQSSSVVLPAAADMAVPARPLRQETLGQHRGELTVPTYDRSALTPAATSPSAGFR